MAGAYAITGSRRQRLWAESPADLATRRPREAQHTPVHEHRFKRSRLCAHMLTSAGRRLAAERHDIMAALLERLEREVAGEV